MKSRVITEATHYVHIYACLCDFSFHFKITMERPLDGEAKLYPKHPPHPRGVYHVLCLETSCAMSCKPLVKWMASIWGPI